MHLTLFKGYNMDEKFVKEMLDYLKLVDDFKPVADLAFKVVKTYGGEISKLLEAVMEVIVTSRITAFLAYKDAGMPDELIMHFMTASIDYTKILEAISKASVKINTE